MHPGGGGVAEEPQRQPANAGRSVIIGIHEAVAPLAVTTRPWAMSASALTSSMVTRAPAGTLTAGLVIPAMRNDSAGMDGLASTARVTFIVVKVMVFAALLTSAPAGTWVPSVVAWAVPTRGPGAPANRAPMTLPGSVPPPVIPVLIIAAGRVPPAIQPGVAVPLPVIH